MGASVVSTNKEPRLLEEKSDEELMLAYQFGDENAFRELYARHSGRVLGFLRSKIRDESKARDVFQATFLKLHKSRSLYNSDFPFTPWLFTICRSELLDSWKKERRSIEDLASEIPERVKIEPETAMADLGQLNVNQRHAIEMRFRNDSSFEEIAKALETSPANARQIVSRAIRILRNFYGEK
jgi:RNA polymerase sigma factor (sigma-70 family)